MESIILSDTLENLVHAMVWMLDKNTNMNTPQIGAFRSGSPQRR